MTCVIDAVMSAVAKARFEVHQLAVDRIPVSGEPLECLDMFNLRSKGIVAKVKAILQ